jgi:hypothetical protein
VTWYVTVHTHIFGVSDVLYPDLCSGFSKNLNRALCPGVWTELSGRRTENSTSGDLHKPEMAGIIT